MSTKEFKERFEKIKNEVDNLDISDLEEKIYKLEEELIEEIEFCLPGEQKDYQSLLKKIKHFKKENEFYDADAELDRMFPNRHDDDFDEDSMSYDSVFGKD